MRLRNHREDVQLLYLSVSHRQDEVGCRACAAIKRYQHLISWAEALLSDKDFAVLERLEDIVVKDAEGKK